MCKSPDPLAVEQGLIARAQSGDSEAAGLLYERHRETIDIVAVSTMGALGIEPDDAKAEAALAFVEWLPRYAPTKGATFITWLKVYLRRELPKRATRRPKSHALTADRCMPSPTTLQSEEPDQSLRGAVWRPNALEPLNDATVAQAPERPSERP